MFVNYEVIVPAIPLRWEGGTTIVSVNHEFNGTVMPTKSDSDIIFRLQLFFVKQ